MNESPVDNDGLQTVENVGFVQKLMSSSPWVVIAVMVHVVAIAIASIVVFGHQMLKDDTAKTEITVSAQQEQIDLIRPPEIVDREQVPKLQDQDIQPSDITEFDPEAENDPEQGDPVAEEMSTMPAGDTTGGSAIGVSGPGHFGIAPSAVGGRKPGGGKYGSRFGKGSGKGGAGGRTNEAITAGLEWLKKHQDADGHWDTANFMKHDAEGEPCSGAGNPVNDVGVTALALLAFLGDGNTLRLGPYRNVVRTGVKWLQDQQREDGLIGMPSSQEYMYSHAIATLTLCEAYGLSEYYRPLKKTCQDALNHISQARNPYGVWRYQPRDNDNDTSITGWMVQALLSGKEFKLVVDEGAFKSAQVWFDNVTDPATGTSGYTKRGEGSSRKVELIDKFPAAKTEALTAVVLLCRCLMYEDPKDSPTMIPAADTINRKPPVWNETDGSIDMYYWYYASYALFQMGGKHWDTWNKKMTDACLKPQKTATPNPNLKGSWDPVDPWGGDGGRVYSTAIMVLCLEAFYRYGKVQGLR